VSAATFEPDFHRQFGFFPINQEKENGEKKAATYKWSALADEGGPAVAPWTCAAQDLQAPCLPLCAIYKNNLYIPGRFKAESK
jgi:hypothetical protein